MIRLLVCDVDGTLTDGSIIYDSAGVESKNFSSKDGLILRVMPRLGVSVLLLTGRSSETTQRRASELGCALIEHARDKYAVLRNYMDENGFDFESTAYIGDDLNDYAAMKACGFKACPADAAREIRDISDYIPPCNGGCGAVRVICEEILMRDGKYGAFLSLWQRK